MNRLARLALFSVLIVALPLLADETPSNKKPNEKESPKGAPKPDDSPKYQVVNRISGKVKEIDLETKQITVEVRVQSSPTSRSTKGVKEEITLAPSVVVRAMKLPERYENNKPKPYTENEKAKLKGSDPKLPGFTSELSRIAEEQMVDIVLSIRKPPPGTPRTRDKDVMPDKPVATMIVIAVDAPPKPSKPEKAEKKIKEANK